jgi:putative lumazine-binding protein
MNNVRPSINNPNKLSIQIICCLSSLTIAIPLCATEASQESYRNETPVEAPTNALASDEKLVKATIELYFQGRKLANLNLLATAFSNNARLVTTKHNNELIISLKEYFSVVKKQGPVSVTTKIIRLEMKGNMVFAEALFDYGNKSYTDFLVLLKTNGNWKIISKTFSLN